MEPQRNSCITCFLLVLFRIPSQAMSNEASQLAARIFKRLYGALVLRPLQRWNASNRATALIEKSEKLGVPVVKPPPLNATKEYLEELLKAHPEIVGEVKNPNTEIIENSNQLKVHVETISAVDNVQSDVPEKATRPLPVSRRKITLGFDAEPEIVPAGKVTISMATDIIRGHYAFPEDHPVDQLAEHYGVDVEDVESLVDYYKPFHFIHNEKEEKPITDPEVLMKKFYPDIYRLQAAHLLLEEREAALKEKRIFTPDMRMSSELLQTPEYTEDNAKWLQDEDERWGKKRRKKLPPPPNRPLLDETKNQVAKSPVEAKNVQDEGERAVPSQSNEEKTKSS